MINESDVTWIWSQVDRYEGVIIWEIIGEFGALRVIRNLTTSFGIKDWLLEGSVVFRDVCRRIVVCLDSQARYISETYATLSGTKKIEGKHVNRREHQADRC